MAHHDPACEYGDIYGGSVIEYIVQHGTDAAVAKSFESGFGQRPAEELNNIHNLAADPAHAAALKKLGGELDAWMKDTGDPRAVNPKDDRWDKYPYHGAKAKAGG